jgi:AcrR family transcriptional regulator
MSRNTAARAPKVERTPVTQKTDRRVLRTRDILGDALVALMHEKPFESITVQQVLDRAKVGRSTFYTHYCDKDDLFLSDVEEFWQAMAFFLSRHKDTSHRVAPVREFFAHVAEARQFYAALVESGKVHDVMEMGRGYFARAIEERLARLAPACASSSTQRTVLAHAFAGALVSLLGWWIDRGMPCSPEQMDDIFHQMVWCGVEGAAKQLPSTPVRSNSPRIDLATGKRVATLRSPVQQR